MSSFMDVVDLYDQPGTEVVSQTRGFTSANFTPDGLPVLVCAFNEEDDLPVTLTALARSTTPVQPYVVDNASTDRTAEFAEGMGAIVIPEKQVGLAHALVAGLGYLAVDNAHPEVLLTDADTIMGHHWAGIHRQYLRRAGESSAVSGTVITHRFGEPVPHRLTSTLRTVANVGKFYVDALRHEPAKGRGPNMGFRFSSRDQAAEVVDGYNVNRITQTDTQLMLLVRDSGAKAVRALDPYTLVLSRGDRIPNLWALARSYTSNEYRKHTLYQDWYERNQQEIEAAEL